MKNSNALLPALVLGLSVVVGSSCLRPDASKPDSSETSNTSSVNSKPALTLENYNRIKTGMSYKQVVEILGSEGVNTMSVADVRGEIASYKWEGESSAETVSLIFFEDELKTKMQMNLK